MEAGEIKLNLDQVWIDRWNQKVDLAFQSLATIQFENGWKDLNPTHLAEVSNKKDYAECLILKASLLRARGEHLQSSRLIAKTLNKYVDYPMTFKMQFELGLDHWCHEDISNALESFMLAGKLAESNMEKALALSNALFSLEALDLERTHIENQLEDLLTKIPQNEIPQIRQQHQAYILRKQFYNLDFNFRYRPTKIIGQPDFFLNYVSLLPYMKNNVHQEFRTLLESQEYLWQGSYRLRTLKGVYIPADKNFDRLTDMIDRLYLWVWFWLSGHKEISITKLNLTLKSIINSLDINILSKENKLLLRNTLNWIQIFSPQLTTNINSCIQNLEATKSDHYPLLQSEFLLIQRIKVLLFCKEQASIPLTQPFLEYFNDIETGQFRKLPSLSNILSPILTIKNKTKEVRIVVDMLQRSVTNNDNEKTINSLLLSRLFWLSAHKKQFQLSEVSIEFGSNKRQIYNLLSRAKKIDPSIKIQIRDRQIFTSLKKTDYIFIGSLQSTNHTPQDVELEVARNTKIENLASISAIKLSFPKKFTRKDLEKSFGLSKTSTGRVLRKWLKENLIKQQSKGKGVYYVWI